MKLPIRSGVKKNADVFKNMSEGLTLLQQVTNNLVDPNPKFRMKSKEVLEILERANSCFVEVQVELERTTKG